MSASSESYAYELNYIPYGCEPIPGTSSNSWDLPSGVIKHGWLENGPFVSNFPNRTSIEHAIFQPAMFDETRSYRSSSIHPTQKELLQTLQTRLIDGDHHAAGVIEL